MKVFITVVTFLVWISLVGCSAQIKTPGEVDLLGTAAAEATQIIQKARATALVLDAQRQATTMVAGSASQAIIPSITQSTSQVIPIQSPETQPLSTLDMFVTPSPTTQGATVELLGVGIGAEGNFIEVYFLAPPAVAGSWYQGNVSVVEESSGTIYNEIPVIPVVGPLFGKPVQAGQIGYVMLVNAPVRLQVGSTVTVTLGEYVFEHVLVK